MGMNKRAERKMDVWLITLIVVGGFLLATGNFPGIGGGNGDNGDSGTGGGAAAGSGGGSVGCGVEDVAFTPKMTRLGKAGTSLSTAAYGYYITTDNLGLKGAASATTVPVAFDMEVLYGENATDYYTVVKNVNVDCADPFFDSVQLPQIETGLASFYVKNSDGTVNKVSANQSLGADDTFEATVTMKASSDQYFGNPTSDCRNIAVVEYDKTYILKATGDASAPVPGFFVNGGTALDGENGLYIPKVADGGEDSFNVKFTSTSSDPITGTDQPRVHVYDCDVDKDEDTLELIEGVEDEDLNRIAQGNQSVTVFLS